MFEWTPTPDTVVRSFHVEFSAGTENSTLCTMRQAPVMPHILPCVPRLYGGSSAEDKTTQIRIDAARARFHFNDTNELFGCMFMYAGVVCCARPSLHHHHHRSRRGIHIHRGVVTCASRS